MLLCCKRSILPDRDGCWIGRATATLVPARPTAMSRRLRKASR